MDIREHAGHPAACHVRFLVMVHVHSRKELETRTSCRTSTAPMRDHLPEPDWHGISSCHLRCAAERKPTRASPSYRGWLAGSSGINTLLRPGDPLPERSASGYA